MWTAQSPSPRPTSTCCASRTMHLTTSRRFASACGLLTACMMSLRHYPTKWHHIHDVPAALAHPLVLALMIRLVRVGLRSAYALDIMYNAAASTGGCTNPGAFLCM